MFCCPMKGRKNVCLTLHDQGFLRAQRCSNKASRKFGLTFVRRNLGAEAALAPGNPKKAAWKQWSEHEVQRRADRFVFCARCLLVYNGVICQVVHVQSLQHCILRNHTFRKNVSHKFVPCLVHVVEAEQWLGCAHDFSEVNRLLDASLTWQFLWDPAGLKDMGNIC